MAESDLIQLKRGSASKWTILNPVLAAGEPGYDRDNHSLKIGNGVDSWNNLPEVSKVAPEDVELAISAYFIQNPHVDETELATAIEDHVNDPNPHPAYDDIQSLVGLFENGLV